MISPSRKRCSPRARLNDQITVHIRTVKGLDKYNNHHEMRHFYSHLAKVKQTDEDGKDTWSRDERIRRLFDQKKAFSKPSLLKVRPGTIKSSDERTKVIDAGGRLIIPKQYYDRAVDLYDGASVVYKEMDLRETEEMQRQIETISERLTPKPVKKLIVKSRVFTARTSPVQVKSSSVLQAKFNRMIQLIDSLPTLDTIRLRRSATPQLQYRSDLL